MAQAHASQLRVRRGVTKTVPFETIGTEAGSGLHFAAEAFAKLVAERDSAGLARAAKASLAIAATLEAPAQSARTGQRVAVGACA